MQQLDYWLVQTVRRVQEKVGCAYSNIPIAIYAQVAGSPDLVSVLDDIFSVLSDFNWTSAHFKVEQ